MAGLITKKNVSNSLQNNKELRGNVPKTKLYNKSILKMMMLD